ncbi:hypothetical protein O4H66_12490 [Comamonadaceae bacterium G21597-S1]|nr:hypothetical protein [Comamonadaceae bacterium G21597-S1]
MQRVIYRVLAVFLAASGLIGVVFPIGALFMPGGLMLLPDTRAFLGAGRADVVPTVRSVHCSPESFGSRLRNGPMRLWDCQLVLGPAATRSASGSAPDPYAGMTQEQACAEFQRRLDSLAAPTVQTPGESATLGRRLPFDRGGELPSLRRMSRDGAPPEYATVWGWRELASRWFVWGGLGLLMFACGAAALYAARVGWRRY